MARPRKKGLDYFPKDVDTWDNYKIIDLVNRYGPLGYCVYDIVRDEVYKNGYYLEIPLDRLAAIIVRKIGNRWVKDKNLVLQIIQYCADIGLFHNALLSQSVITSVGIQQRYSEVTARNKVDTTKFWLLERCDFQEALKSTPKKYVSVTETQVPAAKNPIYEAKNPQKESKSNERKENEIKSGESKANESTVLTDQLYDIILTFNKTCVSLDPVKNISENTKRTLLQLTAQGKVHFNELFERTERSDFLTGRNGRWHIGGNKATFDWIIKPDNINKILSGKFDNKGDIDNGTNKCGNNDILAKLRALEI